MKKSLIALAVLAASGAAMAQSSVTVYGLVDVQFGSVKSRNLTAGVADTSAAAGNSQTVVNSGGLNTNRFGFRGTEDLGGGLKANFNLEQGFSIDSGAASDTSKQFNRQAWVGVSGDFGSTKLGRSTTAYDDLFGLVNHGANTNFAVTSTVFAMTGMTGQAGALSGNNGVYTGTVDNQIYYATPTFGGFSGAIAYAVGENKTASVSSENVLSLHVKYVDGPLVVGFAHQDQDFNTQTAGASSGFGSLSSSTQGREGKYNLLGASYNFGPAKVLFSYNTSSSKIGGSFKDNEYQLGLDIPMGATTVFLGYANAEGKVDGVKTTKADGFMAYARYDLSKRTSLYGGYRTATGKNAATGAKEAEIDQFTAKHQMRQLFARLFRHCLSL